MNTEYNNKENDARIEIERCVLGALLLAGNSAYHTAVELGIRDDSFTNGFNRAVWGICSTLVEEGESIDLVTVHTKSMGTGLAIAEIAKLTTSIVSDAHLESHCRLLNAFRLERMANECGMRLLAAVKDREREKVVTEFEDAIRAYRSVTQHSRVRHISHVLTTAGNELIKRRDNFYSGELSGTDTGLKRLNLMMNGWQRGTLNVVAARPGMGKTALAVHFALSAAKHGKNVCIFAMEMRAERIVDRMVLSVSNLDGEKYRRGEVTEKDIDEFNHAAQAIAQRSIYIDDNSNCTVGYIHATAKRLQEEGKCDMVIIDYLQLTDMASGSAKSYTRENMVTAASRGFKVLAKELDIPVLLLSQLNRAVESRADKKPMLSDLRESGSIEQDADTVLLIHRPEYYDSEDGVVKNEYGEFVNGVGTINLAKQREGGIGEVEFCYDRTLSKIWDNDSII